MNPGLEKAITLFAQTNQLVEAVQTGTEIVTRTEEVKNQQLEEYEYYIVGMLKEQEERLAQEALDNEVRWEVEACLLDEYQTSEKKSAENGNNQCRKE